MKSLKLFNAVISKESNLENFVDLENGIVIPSNALYCKEQILKYFSETRLNQHDLNKTFHKSWKKVKESSRYELYVEQVKHYISNYVLSEDNVYIPNELLNIDFDLPLISVFTYTKEEMTQKCLDMISSGIALKQETIQDLLSLLVGELKYKFTGKEVIRNKEVSIILADTYNIYPNDNVSFLRYIVYRATNKTLLIKDKETVSMIKVSSFNPELMFNQYGLEKLSEIFNRFKPIFLAFKSKCPNTINKISKLSKKNHKPLVTNPLNLVTSKKLYKKDLHWLENATTFSIFKCINSLHNRINGQEYFAYKVRNGKSFSKYNDKLCKKTLKHNYKVLVNHLKEKYDFSDKVFLVDEDIKYSLPTSEKIMIGNVPQGTKFYGKKLAIGIYWENSYGARDLDLSANALNVKVGWNSDYSISNGTLMYSGDITDAPNGAVEYMYINKGLNSPYVIKNNVYSGSNDCKYKIIIGKGSNINKDYMMDSSKLFAEMFTNSVQKQTILGLVYPEKDKNVFILTNMGSGSARVSGNHIVKKKNGEIIDVSELYRNSLIQEYSNQITLNKVLKMLGAKVIKDEKYDGEYIDIRMKSLSKDTLIDIFK